MLPRMSDYRWYTPLPINTAAEGYLFNIRERHVCDIVFFDLFFIGRSERFHVSIKHRPSFVIRLSSKYLDDLFTRFPMIFSAEVLSLLDPSMDGYLTSSPNQYLRLYFEDLSSFSICLNGIKKYTNARKISNLNIVLIKDKNHTQNEESKFRDKPDFQQQILNQRANFDVKNKTGEEVFRPQIDNYHEKVTCQELSNKNLPTERFRNQIITDSVNNNGKTNQYRSPDKLLDHEDNKISNKNKKTTNIYSFENVNLAISDGSAEHRLKNRSLNRSFTKADEARNGIYDDIQTNQDNKDRFPSVKQDNAPYEPIYVLKPDVDVPVTLSEVNSVFRKRHSEFVIEDIYEHDIPLEVRFLCERNLRCGVSYSVRSILDTSPKKDSEFYFKKCNNTTMFFNENVYSCSKLSEFKSSLHDFSIALDQGTKRFRSIKDRNISLDNTRRFPKTNFTNRRSDLLEKREFYNEIVGVETHGEHGNCRVKYMFENISDLCVVPRVLSFDIEVSVTSSSFPVPENDPVIMISLCLSDFGVILFNSCYFKDGMKMFEYGVFQHNINVCFEVIALHDEADLLKTFIDVIDFLEPDFVTSFNGDAFDIPFLRKRGELHDLNGVVRLCDALLNTSVSHRKRTHEKNHNKDRENLEISTENDGSEITFNRDGNLFSDQKIKIENQLKNSPFNLPVYDPNDSFDKTKANLLNFIKVKSNSSNSKKILNKKTNRSDPSTGDSQNICLNHGSMVDDDLINHETSFNHTIKRPGAGFTKIIAPNTRDVNHSRLNDSSFKNERNIHKDDLGKKYSSDYHPGLYGLVHLDCYHWVRRDSYLPMGAQGLKSVCKQKLGYSPEVVDFDDGFQDAQSAGVYAASDAIGAYLVCEKYARPFAMSLCTLIPLSVHSIVVFGSGTLCEVLLISKAFEQRVLVPNKSHSAQYANGGRLCAESSYVGGHVESLECGIFRSDLSYDFSIDVSFLTYVSRNIDKILESNGTSEDIDKNSILNALKEFYTTASQSQAKCSQNIDQKVSTVKNSSLRVNLSQNTSPMIDKSQITDSVHYTHKNQLKKGHSSQTIDSIGHLGRSISKILNSSQNIAQGSYSSSTAGNTIDDEAKNEQFSFNNFLCDVDSNSKDFIDNESNSQEDPDGMVTRKYPVKNKGQFFIKDKPSIVHLDVSAMYPNIILTNRLQPTAVIHEDRCMKCDYYSQRNDCQKKMIWRMKAKYYTPTRNEIVQIERQLENSYISDEEVKRLNLKVKSTTRNKITKGTDKNVFSEDSVVSKVDFPNSNGIMKYSKFENSFAIENLNHKYGGLPTSYACFDKSVDHNSVENLEFPEKSKNRNLKIDGNTHTVQKMKYKYKNLSQADRAKILESRITTFAKQHYQKVHRIETLKMQNVVCQRDEPFYVDVVRDFRNKRYVYKDKHKAMLNTAKTLMECSKNLSENKPLFYEGPSVYLTPPMTSVNTINSCRSNEKRPIETKDLLEYLLKTLPETHYTLLDTYEIKECLKNNNTQQLANVLSDLATEASRKAGIFESLQIAHKCVLNSFYGYVMRKGSRWHSMEMAAIVCEMGGRIIKRAKALLESVGTILELDTDGIWVMLPSTFPNSFGNGRSSLILLTLNYMINQEFTNHQYMEKSIEGIREPWNTPINETLSNLNQGDLTAETPQQELFEQNYKKQDKKATNNMPVHHSNRGKESHIFVDGHEHLHSQNERENFNMPNVSQNMQESVSLSQENPYKNRKNSFETQNITVNSNSNLPTYVKKPLCTIEFEQDGPYKAMIIPASTEEGKLLKKKYVVINQRNKISELKGFETKRRGELGIIKKFQEELFTLFTSGKTLRECYQEITTCCNYWLALIESKGSNMETNDIFELFSESKNMSKKYKEYFGRKTTATNTALRLSQIIGAHILESPNLKTQYIISKYPKEKPTTERTIPIEIYTIEESIRRPLLKKWIGKDSCNVRDIMDWEYYKQRLESVIVKLVLIPGTSQGMGNILPSIKIPEWARISKKEKIQHYTRNVFKNPPGHQPKIYEPLIELCSSSKGNNQNNLVSKPLCEEMQLNMNHIHSKSPCKKNLENKENPPIKLSCNNDHSSANDLILKSNHIKNQPNGTDKIPEPPCNNHLIDDNNSLENSKLKNLCKNEGYSKSNHIPKELEKLKTAEKFLQVATDLDFRTKPYHIFWNSIRKKCLKIYEALKTPYIIEQTKEHLVVFKKGRIFSQKFKENVLLYLQIKNSDYPEKITPFYDQQDVISLSQKFDANSVDRFSSSTFKPSDNNNTGTKPYKPFLRIKSFLEEINHKFNTSFKCDTKFISTGNQILELYCLELPVDLYSQEFTFFNTALIKHNLSVYSKAFKDEFLQKPILNEKKRGLYCENSHLNKTYVENIIIREKYANSLEKSQIKNIILLSSSFNAQKHHFISINTNVYILCEDKLPSKLEGVINKSLRAFLKIVCPISAIFFIQNADPGHESTINVLTELKHYICSIQSKVNPYINCKDEFLSFHLQRIQNMKKIVEEMICKANMSMIPIKNVINMDVEHILDHILQIHYRNDNIIPEKLSKHTNLLNGDCSARLAKSDMSYSITQQKNIYYLDKDASYKNHPARQNIPETEMFRSLIYKYGRHGVIHEKGLFNTFCTKLNLKNTTILSIIECKTVYIIDQPNFVYEREFISLQNFCKKLVRIISESTKSKFHNRLLQKFDTWLNETELVSSLMKANVKQLHIQYLAYIYYKTSTLGVKIIFANTETILLDTRKHDIQSTREFFTWYTKVLRNITGLEMLKISLTSIYRKCIFIDFTNYHFIDKSNRKVISHANTRIKKSFLELFFANKFKNTYFYDLLIRKKYKSVDSIKKMLDIIDTAYNTHELRLTSSEILKIDFFHSVDVKNCFMDVLCSSCHSVTTILFKKNDRSKCVSCTNVIDDQNITEAIVSLFKGAASKDFCVCREIGKRQKMLNNCLCLTNTTKDTETVQAIEIITSSMQDIDKKDFLLRFIE